MYNYCKYYDFVLSLYLLQQQKSVKDDCGGFYRCYARVKRTESFMS